MTVFVLLLATFAGLHLVSLLGVKRFKSNQAKARWAMGLMFVFAGALHFIVTETYQMMMPPFLPYSKLLVYLSGVLEIVGGFGLLISKVQRWAAYGLILLLILVFPANLYVAIANVPLGGYMSSSLYHWLRLPFQVLLIWWAYWSTNPHQKAAANSQAENEIGEPVAI